MFRRGKYRNASIVAAWVAVISFTKANAQPVDTPRPDFWTTDGTINALVEKCGILYIGGSFSNIGPQTGNCGLISASGGLVSSAFPRFSGGEVNAVAPDGAGGWYVGGLFRFVNGTPYDRLVHIRSDNSVDPTWTPNPDAQVLAITVSGNTVYVGGFFQNIDGQLRRRIAALDAVTGHATDWNPDANNSVRSLIVSGNVIYIGGAFTQIDGQTRRRLAALNKNANSPSTYLANWNPDVPSGTVRSLVLSEITNTVYVGGEFTTIDGQNRHYIAALDATTTISSNYVTAWNPDANLFVRTLLVSGNTIYAGGDFTHIGGANRSHIAALDANLNTNNAKPWDPTAGNNVNSLAIADGMIYAGGDFTIMDGQTRYRIAAIDADAMSNYVTAWNPSADNSVNCVVIAGDSVCAGGVFSSIGRVVRTNIAAIDTATGKATTWDPNANGIVHTLDVSGSVAYAGGEFITIDGQNRNRVAAINISDGHVTNWNPNADSTVRALMLSGNLLYVGGDFANIGGQGRAHIAALNTLMNSNNASSWNPIADNNVHSIVIAGNIVYTGGEFNVIDGQTRHRIAALDATASAPPYVTSWNPNAGSIVRALALSANIVYVGGDFTTIDGQNRNYIAAINASNGHAASWDPSASSNVRALAVSGNTIYVGGDFMNIGSRSRNRIAALDANSNIATAWNPNAGGSVNAIALAGTLSDNSVFAGGSFTTVGGQNRQGLAAFSVLNSEWTGGTGFWDESANWSPPIVPDNSGCDVFNVHIANSVSNAHVTLDLETATINSLVLDSAATLSVSQGSLNIVTPEGIRNDGNLSVGGGRAVIAGAPMTISGAQPIQLTGGRLSSSDASNIVTLTTPVEGFGQIDAAFVNQSIINANVSAGILLIDGSFSATSDATLRASNDGTLMISRSVGGSPTLLAEGGGIVVSGDSSTNVTGSTLTVTGGGSAVTDGLARLGIAHDCVIACFPGFLGCSPPILHVIGGSGISIGGNLSFEGSVDVSVYGGTSFDLAGDFKNHSTSPETFNWTSGPLNFNGVAPQTFEMAGQDFGDSNPAGFIHNFEMGTLTVEPGCTVNFRNDFDNIGGGGCEVLYVNTLILGAGSTIQLNGCNIYWRGKSWDPSATIITGGGAELHNAQIGDMNCDGSVGGDDIQAFLLALTDPNGYVAAYPDCSINHADLDLNQTVNINDVAAFVNFLLQGT